MKNRWYMCRTRLRIKVKFTPHGRWYVIARESVKEPWGDAIDRYRALNGFRERVIYKIKLIKNNES